MGNNFSIPALLNLCSESVGAQMRFEILVEESNTCGPSSIAIRMKYLFAFQFWYCERFAENRWGGDRKHCFVNFRSLAVLSLSLVEGLWGEGWKSYLGPAEIASFPSRHLSGGSKHYTFWDVISTSYFYVLFLWAIAVSDFLPLEIYKNLDHPLSCVTSTVTKHAENYFYKYIHWFQILCNLKEGFL